MKNHLPTSSCQRSFWMTPYLQNLIGFIAIKWMQQIHQWLWTKILLEQAKYQLLKSLFNVSTVTNALQIITIFLIMLNITMDSIENAIFLTVMWGANLFKNLYSIMSDIRIQHLYYPQACAYVYIIFKLNNIPLAFLSFDEIFFGYPSLK